MFAFASALLFFAFRGQDRTPVITLQFRFFQTNALGIMATFVASNTTSRDFTLQLYGENATNGVFTKCATIQPLNYGIWTERSHGYVELIIPTNQSPFRAAADCVPVYTGFFANILPYVRKTVARKGPGTIHIYSEEVRLP